MSADVDLYGLKNCDGCRKALRALEARGLEIRQLDIRDTLHTRRVVEWISAQGDWELFLNKRSTTWRKLPENVREHVDSYSAVALMNEHPTLIKRPALRIGGRLLAGYKPEQVDAALSARDAS